MHVDLSGQKETAMKTCFTTAIRIALFASAAAVAAAGLTGCTSVAPYERANLAKPSMSAEDPFTSGMDEHVREVSEAGNGGLAGGGGGCGCN
jgi:hypothetical protein